MSQRLKNRLIKPLTTLTTAFLVSLAPLGADEIGRDKKTASLHSQEPLSISGSFDQKDEATNSLHQTTFSQSGSTQNLSMQETSTYNTPAEDVAEQDNFGQPKVSPFHRIEIHNCILFSFRDSIITLMDVVRRLDAKLHQMNLKEDLSLQERLEYYQSQWRLSFQELIDNELIYQDAVDFGASVSEGDTKDELIRRFGDQYLSTLATLDISLSEAMKMIRKELLIQRMYYYRVDHQVRSQITPSLLLSYYEQYLKENPRTDIWVYRTLSLRGPLHKTKQIAEEIELKIRSSTSFEEIEKEIYSKSELASDVKISLSEPTTQNSQELSARYLGVLSALEPGQASEILDFSKNSREGLFRILFLDSKEHREPKTVEEMHRVLEDKAWSKLSEEYSRKYIIRLRKRLESEMGMSLNEILNPPFVLFNLR